MNSTNIYAALRVSYEKGALTEINLPNSPFALFETVKITVDFGQFIAQLDKTLDKLVESI